MHNAKQVIANSRKAHKKSATTLKIGEEIKDFHHSHTNHMHNIAHAIDRIPKSIKILEKAQRENKKKKYQPQ